ncbi:DODA-type extradiol aromatic ring-opening family dioxygenase [Acetobacter fallax]|uniref:Dioxygenase n=1 Tax=Acetobacter fallax TaxID=1737473 RepID=A0ABX0K6N8_9PROT|nr:class III extradiol ring-cleavage dioxygenase [Acetobacter fallax]NHO31124.1 dioxygenase [Acetobacter fallax]NHO34681.1 dioxygenase [Acetobacter fallax]
MTGTSAEHCIRQPVLFLPHGGGPCFFMDWPGWGKLEAHLRSIATTLPRKPDAILVVSGHWETEIPAVTSGKLPELIYDYYGFPEHTYDLRYPVPGSPRIASRVRALLTAAGIPNVGDDVRGLDHGVFIPFMLAFPDAEIPVVELSLGAGMSPTKELAVGHALRPLRAENILIVATGMTFHNLPQFLSNDRSTDAASRAFDAWLVSTIEAAPDLRDEALRHWDKAPGARICHPREEHLLPLMIAAGAAGTDRGQQSWHDIIMGKALSGFRFG